MSSDPAKIGGSSGDIIVDHPIGSSTVLVGNNADLTDVLHGISVTANAKLAEISPEISGTNTSNSIYTFAIGPAFFEKFPATKGMCARYGYYKLKKFSIALENTAALSSASGEVATLYTTLNPSTLTVPTDLPEWRDFVEARPSKTIIGSRTISGATIKPTAVIFKNDYRLTDTDKADDFTGLGQVTIGLVVAAPSTTSLSLTLPIRCAIEVDFSEIIISPSTSVVITGVFFEIWDYAITNQQAKPVAMVLTYQRAWDLTGQMVNFTNSYFTVKGTYTNGEYTSNSIKHVPATNLSTVVYSDADHDVDQNGKGLIAFLLPLSLSSYENNSYKIESIEPDCFIASMNYKSKVRGRIAYQNPEFPPQDPQEYRSRINDLALPSSFTNKHLLHKSRDRRMPKDFKIPTIVNIRD